VANKNIIGINVDTACTPAYVNIQNKEDIKKHTNDAVVSASGVGTRLYLATANIIINITKHKPVKYTEFVQ
jgi:hypothetical protein